MFENIKYVSSGKFVSKGMWIHPDRIINSFEIIFVIEGTVFINENGVEYTLVKNDLLILDPGLRHFGYRESSDTSFYWVHWTGSCPLPEEKKLCIGMPYDLSLLFSQLLHYSNGVSLRESMDYITRLILAAVCRAWSESTESRMVNNIAQWIKNNSDVMIKTSDVARQFGYNADYLSRLFTRYYNKSLKKYIDQSKLQFIKTQLLNTNYTLREISDACGFSEYKYFLKFFKYHENLTPTEFCNTYYKTHINNK